METNDERLYVGAMHVTVDMHCYTEECIAEWYKRNMDLESIDYAEIILDEIESRIWQMFDGNTYVALDDAGNVRVTTEGYMTRKDMVKLAEHMSGNRIQLDEITGDRLDEWFEPEDFVDQDAYAAEHARTSHTVFIDVVLTITVI